MGIFALVLVLGVVGGAAIGVFVYGRWRQRLLWMWMLLPVIVYSAVMFWGGVEAGRAAWSEAVGWWLIGLLRYVGLPTLLFAASSAIGFIAVPAPAKPWRLKDWRLPQ